MTDESTEDEEERRHAEERHVYLEEGKKREMHKSLRKKLGHSMQEIRSKFQDEEQHKKRQDEGAGSRGACHR